jgi:hypothetical protein
MVRIIYQAVRFVQNLQLARIAGLLLAVLLSACSAVKMGYNNAPELSYWWLDSYLDFNTPQTLKVRTDLAALQAWHRQSELPVYVGTLEKLQHMAPSNVTSEQVCALFADVMPRIQAVVDQAESTVTAVAPTLKAAQLDYLSRKLDKRNLKWREDWIEGTPAEHNTRRVKQLADWAEIIYGKLEEPQLAVLRASVAASSFDAATSNRESLRRHQDALQTLRQLQSGTQSALRTRVAVHALLGRSMDSPDAAYRDYMEKITQENCQAFAAMHNSTTPAQRRKAIETLKDYEDDARALMASGR